MEYGCIGEKLTHSFSKEIHALLFDYDYKIQEITKDKLCEFMAKKDFKAINVTIPYKQDVIPYLDWISDTAKTIGAVNTIVNRDGKLYGYNTDFYGMKMLIEKAGINIKNKTVAILGSGGTSNTAFAVANNMGAAMAPAAYDTICNFLNDTDTAPEDYDMIFTGDLGLVGARLFCELFKRDAVDISRYHKDCGLMIFDLEKQDVHSGGSGCGCSASVLCSHILSRLYSGEYKNILFCATGALLSPTSTMQGDNIPVIAHAVNIKSSQSQ